MTFPGGTQDIWIRYWLKAAKVDANLLKIITIPPPQMVANMKVDAMDGFCVGEPWNAQAVDQGIGFTHLTTQDLWKHHPEKALVVTEKFATERPDVLEDVMGAVLKAGKWLDDLGNRKQAARPWGRPATSTPRRRRSRVGSWVSTSSGRASPTRPTPTIA